MNPWKVSAQFAAFVWYSNQQSENRASPAEAAQFAKENWVAFLPCAHEGYGRLLIKIAQPGKRTRGTRNRTETTAGLSKALRTSLALAQ